MTGADTHDADGFPRALELLASGRLPLDLLVEPQDVGLDGLLDAAHRCQIVDFYHRVFGLREYEMMTEDRKQLVLGAYTAEQFVFLIADDAPMRCPRLDHFGLSVGSEAELDELLARCRAYQRQDDRVDIIDKRTDDFGVVKIKSFYVRYLLPLMVEVQRFEYGEGGRPGQGSTGAGT